VKIVYGSSNRGKLAEVLQFARMHQFELVSLCEVCDSPADIPEGGDDYETNAVAKAKGYAKQIGRACIADDAGVEIECLGGLPGVYTGRFGLARLSSMLQPGVRYRAQFVCCASYAEPDGRSVSLQKRISGVFCVPKEVGGEDIHLPFSAYFIPNGEIQSLQSLVARGGYLSHRVRAIDALLNCLGVYPK
jgi:XTP/dITP diphosphohydrolase